MSAKGRPEREHRSAQHEGNPATAKGRPEREHRSAQHEGNPATAKGRPEGEHRSAQREGAPSTRIDHLAVWTGDLDRLAHFYVTYFGATAGERYTNAAKGFASRFLTFGDGARIELMASSTLALAGGAPGEQRRGFTHVALAVGSEQRVDAMTQQLRADGHPVVDGPRRTGDGYYESVVLDPDGNRVEITA